MFHFFRRGHHCLEAQMHAHHHGTGRGGRGPKMFDAGAMRYVVLHLIAAKPRHGYELIKEIEQLAGGGYSPSPGAIYPLLSLLLDMGHIQSTADGNKKLHSITAEGQAFLAENAQLVEAVLARLSGPSDGKRGDARILLHELKHTLIDVVRDHANDDGKMNAMIAILRRALADIAALR
ncbi:MAG: PadR family transcriptional regulator [Pseudomonadota bacterium]